MARSKSDRRGQLVPLLVLLALLFGAGAWNYHRNVAAEAAEVRPYRTLSEPDLATLIAAYESELQQISARHERAQRQGAPSGGGDGWSRFEAVQQHSRAVRELGRGVAEHEAALEELRKEQQRRGGSELRRFLARVFTYSG